MLYLTAFILFVLINILIFNIKEFNSISRQSLYIRYSIFYIFIFFIFNFIFFDNNFYILYNMIIIIIFSYCYFHIFNMALTARRVNLLCIIYFTKNLKYDDLFVMYSPKTMIDIRINRLLSNNWIFKDSNDILHIKSLTTLRIATILNFIRLKFFRGF